MASDLEQQRDHCRKMAALTEHPRPKSRHGSCSSFVNQHGRCPWGWQSCACTCHDRERPQPPTDADRALWTRLADEIDAYLNGDLCVDCGRPKSEVEPGLWEVDAHG